MRVVFSGGGQFEKEKSNKLLKKIIIQLSIAYFRTSLLQNDSLQKLWVTLINMTSSLFKYNKSFKNRKSEL